MADDDLYKTVGRIEGKLDTMIVNLAGYTQRHEERHKAIDGLLDDVKGDINQAKGAKGVLLYVVGGISAAVAFVTSHLPKWLQ